MRFCLTPRCPNLVEGRRVTHCPEHKVVANNWAQKNFERSSSGWQWAAIRKRVLRRDNNRCQVVGCDAHATEVDHILPVSKGGTDSMVNLRSLCSDHHRIKSEQERIAGLRNRIKGA